MHFKNLFYAGILAGFSQLPAALNAGERPDKVRIAVIDDVPSTIAAVQILETAYQRLDINMTTLVAPSRRALLMADTGNLDGDLFRIATVAEGYPNLVRVDFPLLKGKLHAVVRNREIQQLPESRTNDPIKVAIRRGVIIAENTATELDMEPIHAESYEQVRTLLEMRRVDLAFVASIEGITPMANADWHHLHILPEPVATFILHHYLNRRHAGLAEDLAEVLVQLEQEGVRGQILRTVRGKQKDGEW
ncbi:hypothetical protein DET61_1132 [Marinobacter nauticus]|uniref:Solute-binding protein family 3/N-terminal domain-containing protein n=1 Tax=Marinobacter nauticus TaxID=2743 RepID=A0A368XAI9_MARNT|nr:hypothetical protein [Marinobacter nauticus]RCW64981.1 hypothetical protein DET61_1132 [Marinobacter nauticus]